MRKHHRFLKLIWLEYHEDGQKLPTTGEATEATFNFGTNQPMVPSGGFTFGWRGIIMFYWYNIGSIVGFIFSITFL